MSDRPRNCDWLTLVVAVVLGIITSAALTWSSGSVGYARDEGVYFEAGRHYAAWVDRLVREPRRAMQPKVRDRYFAINHEHPALMKTLGGLSARLLAEPPAPKTVGGGDDDREAAAGGRFPVMREGTAMRLPSHLLAGVGVFLLVLLGRRLGETLWAGVLAAGWFILLPRVVFHASLDAFDVPIAVATLAVAFVYLRGLRSWKWGIAAGPVLGIAVAIKHNALFLGPVLALHYVVCLVLAQRLDGRRVRWQQLFPLPLWSMATLGPLTAIALWPWMWSDTVSRLAEYFAFHQKHSYYNMEFMGVNYNRPPLPVEYPFVMTWATVPSALLLLALVGMVLLTKQDLTRTSAHHPGQTRAGLIIVMFASFPLVLIALPWVPIFGGTKHWLTAYPFMGLAAAVAWARLWRAARVEGVLRHAQPVALVAILVPSLWATTRGHPHNLSQYAPLAGGARGAAQLGLNRGFWGHAVVPILKDARGSGETERVFVHDIHALAQKQYEREGRWPDWKRTGPTQATRALIFHERHMLSEEIEVWNARGSTAPSSVLTLDDVPLTSEYGG